MYPIFYYSVTQMRLTFANKILLTLLTYSYAIWPGNRVGLFYSFRTHTGLPDPDGANNAVWRDCGSNVDHWNLPWTCQQVSHWLAFQVECSRQCDPEMWQKVLHQERHEWRVDGTVVRCRCDQVQTYYFHHTSCIDHVHCPAPSHSLTLRVISYNPDHHSE